MCAHNDLNTCPHCPGSPLSLRKTNTPFPLLTVTTKHKGQFLLLVARRALNYVACKEHLKTDFFFLILSKKIQKCIVSKLILEIQILENQRGNSCLPFFQFSHINNSVCFSEKRELYISSETISIFILSGDINCPWASKCYASTQQWQIIWVKAEAVK